MLKRDKLGYTTGMALVTGGKEDGEIKSRRPKKLQ